MTHEPFSNYYWHTHQPKAHTDTAMRQTIADLEAYRAELIKLGQPNAGATVYARAVADRLGSILRPLYD